VRTRDRDAVALRPVIATIVEAVRVATWGHGPNDSRAPARVRRWLGRCRGRSSGREEASLAAGDSVMLYPKCIQAPSW
jgi:hypothetical protein